MCLGKVFFDLLGILNGVCTIVCAGDVNDNLVILLGMALSFLELIVGFRSIAVKKGKSAETNVVISAIGISGYTGIEVFAGFGLVAFGELGLAEIVVGHGLVGVTLI